MKLDKPKYLMKCGHVANATINDKPCCVICAPKSEAYLIAREILNDEDGLKDRQALCQWCAKRTKSKWTLPFFKYKPVDSYDSYYCGCGGWD